MGSVGAARDAILRSGAYPWTDTLWTFMGDTVRRGKTARPAKEFRETEVIAMQMLNKETQRTAIVVALLIALAIFLRNSVPLTGHGPLEAAAAAARFLIYVVLFTAWGISLHRRIMQVQVRRYLVAIVIFMVFWIVIRTLKFRVFHDPFENRICWYLYYIPMLLIPMLSLFAAVAIGKPEQYRTPKWMHLLWVPTILLVLLVLTNDLHQMVFQFPHLPWTDDEYSYAIGYWLVTVWELCSAASALGIILHKCRILHSKKRMVLPLIPFALLILYIVGYIMSWKWMHFVAGDMTVTLCILIAAIFESCIQCSLIQSNTHYNELFGASTVAAQIVDKDYHVYISSDTSTELPSDTLRQTENAPVMRPGNIRLSSAPIVGGHVVWEEDVSGLATVSEKLEDANEYLEGRNATLAEEYRTNRRRRHLVEQNRLYDMMQKQTADKIARLSELVEQLAALEDGQGESWLLYQITVLGTYIKRRNNLIFLAEERRTLPVSELANCIRETMQSLELSGAFCEYQAVENGELPFADLMYLYDALETVIEKTFPALTDLFVAVTFENGQPVMRLRLSDLAALPDLGIENLSVQNEDEGEWLLICRPCEGGERT